MATLKGYIDAPLFYDDTELSASLLNVLKNNTELIKHSVTMPQVPFDVHRVLSNVRTTWIWRGGFQYRTGVEDAVFVIYSKETTASPNYEIVIRFDDVEVDRYDAGIGGINVGGYTVRTIAIDTRGYVDYQIITVTVIPEVVSGGDPSKGLQWVFDAYITPLSGVDVGTWPGIPTFGTVTSTKLNQLSNAADYLANRLAIVPKPLSINYVEWMGTNNPAFPTFRYFTARATNGNPRLRTNVFYQCQQTSASISLNIGGVITTYGPYIKGQKVLITFDVDMIASGLSYDVDYFSSIYETVHVTGGSSDGHGGFVFSRINSGIISQGATSYSLPALLDDNQILESITFSELQTRLTAIGTQLDTAHTRIGAHDKPFNVATMFRARHTSDAGQNEFWNSTFLHSLIREGDILWVKGQGVKIGYGPSTREVKSESKPNDIWKYTFATEKELLPGDKVTQQYFYLDQFEGLYPGMRYYIIGKDITYAAEHLR